MNLLKSSYEIQFFFLREILVINLSASTRFSAQSIYGSGSTDDLKKKIDIPSQDSDCPLRIFEFTTPIGMIPVELIRKLKLVLVSVL